MNSLKSIHYLHERCADDAYLTNLSLFALQVNYCNSSIPLAALMTSQRIILLQFVENRVEFLWCGKERILSKNTSFEDKFYLKCVGGYRELKQEFEQKLEQLDSEIGEDINLSRLKINCTLKADDLMFEKSKKNCGEINYLCYVANSPSVFSKMEPTYAALSKGGVIAIAVVGGIIAVALIFGAFRKVRFNYNTISSVVFSLQILLNCCINKTKNLF